MNSRLKAKIYFLFLLSFSGVLLAVWVPILLPAPLLMILGGFFNLLVILLNGGKMPVKIGPVNKRVSRHIDDRYVTISRETKLKFLADRFDFGEYTYSIGDIIIFAAPVYVLVLMVLISFRIISI